MTITKCACLLSDIPKKFGLFLVYFFLYTVLLTLGSNNLHIVAHCNNDALSPLYKRWMLPLSVLCEIASFIHEASGSLVHPLGCVNGAILSFQGVGILYANEWFSSNLRLSYAHRIVGSLGGKHCKSLQRNVWCGAVSPLKTVSLDRECRILPWFYEKRRWLMLVLWNCKFLWDQCYEIYR